MRQGAGERGGEGGGEVGGAKRLLCVCVCVFGGGCLCICLGLFGLCFFVSPHGRRALYEKCLQITVEFLPRNFEALQKEFLSRHYNFGIKFVAHTNLTVDLT